MFLLYLQISDGERSDQDLVVDDGGEVKVAILSIVLPTLIGIYFWDRIQSLRPAGITRLGNTAARMASTSR
jgi:hypothetical protein